MGRRLGADGVPRWVYGLAMVAAQLVGPKNELGTLSKRHQKAAFGGRILHFGETSTAESPSAGKVEGIAASTDAFSRSSELLLSFGRSFGA